MCIYPYLGEVRTYYRLDVCYTTMIAGNENNMFSTHDYMCNINLLDIREKILNTNSWDEKLVLMYCYLPEGTATVFMGAFKCTT